MVNTMALGGWALLLLVIIVVFIWLWRFAAKIERLEVEEQQWLAYIDQLQQYDPYQAQQWKIMFDQKFK